MTNNACATNDFVVLIPAYNPDEKLVELTQALTGLGLPTVVLDDGSEPDRRPVFQRLENIEGAMVLRHVVNLGKGAALKTALNHIAVAFPDKVGIVCADADGQHTVKDILAVGESLVRQPNALTLGVRTFRNDIPLRSRIGNLMTRRIFNFLTGLKLTDTQTGLRGIPMALVPLCMNIRPNRYEYELEMLIRAKQHGSPIVQTPIETIYIDDNKSSHFNVLTDSLRIYFVLFRFVFSSLLAALLEYALFMILYGATKNLLLSQYAARACSGTFNYAVNRKFVFASRAGILGSLPRYVVLAALLALGSYALIRGFVWLNIPVAAAKPIAEGLLFIASFSAQRKIVFRHTKGTTPRE